MAGPDTSRRILSEIDEIKQLRRDLEDLRGTTLDRLASGVIPVKTTTGDPASPKEGQLYANTSDNLLRLYIEGAWTTVHTW